MRATRLGGVVVAAADVVDEDVDQALTHEQALRVDELDVLDLAGMRRQDQVFLLGLLLRFLAGVEGLAHRVALLCHRPAHVDAVRDDLDTLVLDADLLEAVLSNPDPSKAKDKLGWVPEITAQEMCAEMVTNDLGNARRQALLKTHGYPVNVSLE
mgnify:CR=1 FL=1